MSENRKRNQTLSIRLTPAEKDAIVKQAAEARMSLTDYILTSALVTEIHVAEDIRPLITELKRIGNNLNQLTALANMKQISVVYLDKVAEGLANISAAVRTLQEYRRW